MKWFIASDIHGSEYYCKKMLEAFERERADRILLLGDLLYHGPRNDLPRDYAPKAVIAMLGGISAFAATARRRLTKWCSIFRLWRTMRLSRRKIV